MFDTVYNKIYREKKGQMCLKLLYVFFYRAKGKKVNLRFVLVAHFYASIEIKIDKKLW